MSLLEKALKTAFTAHAGQTDKLGFPYVFHPIRVMLRMETEEEMVVALLHDTVEDSLMTLEDLRNDGFSDAVVEAVDCLTRKDESYKEFILRVKENPIALKVKLGDLADNTDPRRATYGSPKRNVKYQKAIALLTT